MKAGQPLRASLRLNNDVGVEEFVESPGSPSRSASIRSGCRTTCSSGRRRCCSQPRRPGRPRRRWGTCVLNPYSMHPAEIAMTAATLQELSAAGSCSASPPRDRLPELGGHRPTGAAPTHAGGDRRDPRADGGRSPADVAQWAGLGGCGAAADGRDADADLPRGDVVADARTHRRGGRRRTPVALPAGVVRRDDGARACRRAAKWPRRVRCRRGGVHLGVRGRGCGARPPAARREARLLRGVVRADILDRVGVDAASLAELRDLDLDVAINDSRRRC